MMSPAPWVMVPLEFSATDWPGSESAAFSTKLPPPVVVRVRLPAPAAIAPATVNV